MPIYDYTDNGTPDALVNTDSQAFQDRLDYLMLNSPATTYEVGEYTGSSWGNASNPVSRSFTRGIVHFHGDGGKYSGHDAYLIQQSPEVTLAGIYSDFKVTPPQPLPQFADHTPPTVDPIGAPWPEKGVNIWHVSSQFDPAIWPMGCPPFVKRVDGRDMSFYRTKVRGTSAPSGTVGGSATYVPAWTDKANP